MNDKELARQRNNLAELFQQYSFDDDQEANNSVVQTTNVPQSLNQLSSFSLLRKQIEIQKEIYNMQKVLEPDLLKKCLKVREVAYENERLSEEVKKCLEFLCTSSQDIEYVLTNITVKDALPLPHHLHRKAVSMVEACAWLIKNERWHPADHEGDWDSVIPKLQQEIKEWKSFVMQMERNLQENIFLKDKIKMVLDNLHRL